MKGRAQDDGKTSKVGTATSRLYFISAFVMLVLLSLLWSVDISFFYIFVGAAVFFFYLGIQKSSIDFFSPKPNGDSYKRSFETQADSFSWIEILRSFFLNKNAQSASAPPVQPAVKAKRIAIVVWVVFVSVFSIFFLIAIFSEDDFSEAHTYYYSAAEQFYINEEYDSAYRHYKIATNLSPTHAESWNGLGNVKLLLGSYDSALFYYNQAASG